MEPGVPGETSWKPEDVCSFFSYFFGDSSYSTCELRLSFSGSAHFLIESRHDQSTFAGLFSKFLVRGARRADEKFSSRLFSSFSIEELIEFRIYIEFEF